MPSTLVKSFGEIFGDCLLEAIVDPSHGGQLRWLCKKPGENHVICRQPGLTQDDHRRIYRALDDVDPYVLDAVRFPRAPIPYGTNGQLFEAICEVLKKYTSLTDLFVSLAAFAAMASWRPERGDVPVCLAISGPPAERRRLLAVLLCLFRRPLHLAECKLSGLESLPRTLNPSLFIEHCDSPSQVRKLLRATSLRDAHVLSHGRPIDTHCAKVVCVDQSWKASFPEWPAIEISVPGADGDLPRFEDQEQNAQKLQGMLMMYRLENYLEPARSLVDLPELTPHSRELLRSLGLCLVADGELQKTLVAALRAYDSDFEKPYEDVVQSATVEVLLESCHGSQTIVHLKEITARVNRGLEPSVAALPLIERSLGPVVRKLGFATHERDRFGFFVRLLQSTRTRIHKLARDCNMLARKADVLCSDCREFQPLDEGDEELIKAIGF